MQDVNLEQLFDSAEAFFQREEERLKDKQESDDGWDRENRLNAIMASPAYHEMGR